jgi:hypothetical protein
VFSDHGGGFSVMLDAEDFSVAICHTAPAPEQMASPRQMNLVIISEIAGSTIVQNSDGVAGVNCDKSLSLVTGVKNPRSVAGCNA